MFALLPPEQALQLAQEMQDAISEFLSFNGLCHDRYSSLQPVTLPVVRISTHTILTGVVTNF